ncbi:MAG: OsmC family protein, partial [Cyanobacteria bacterium J06607_15]
MSDTVTAEVKMPLRPLDKEGLDNLVVGAKENPTEVKTLKIKTVCEGKFRNLNYARDLPVQVVDEPPGLLGENTAQNPSEILLSALGSCLSVGIHANARAKGIELTKLELELEGDINITSVWGINDSSEAPLGITDVRIKAYIEGDASQEELAELVAHANQWSPTSKLTGLRTVLEI